MKRFNSAAPCPICSGHDNLPRGKGRRCYGFYSSDGRYAHCSRADHAGALPEMSKSGTYAHRLDGPCSCGGQHDGGLPVTEPAKRPTPWRFHESQIAAIHLYTDDIQVCRLTQATRANNFPKCMPRHRGADSNWYCGLGPYRSDDLPLYREQEVLAGLHADDTIYITEGESDSDAIYDAEALATTNAFGAHKFRDHHAKTLASVESRSKLVVVADQDEPCEKYPHGEGLHHAAEVRNKLLAAGVADDRIEIVIACSGKDARDHLGAGFGLEDLQRVETPMELGDVDSSEFVPEGPTSRASNRVHELTDTANADRLIARCGDDLRYVPLWKRWLVWDGTKWAQDVRGGIVLCAKDTARQIHLEAAETDDTRQQESIGGWARTSQSEPRIRAMVKLAAPEVPIAPNELDSNPLLLCVENGVLDLRTAKLHDARRSDFITRAASVKFDESAQADRWAAFLEKVLPDKDVRDYVQRAVGYAFTAETREQVLFMLYGTGANGKSTFVETLRALLADYAQAAPADFLLNRRSDGIPNDVARLRGARFVSVVETDIGRHLSEAKVKQLTGGDTVSARFMRGEFFDFKPVAKLFIATNHRPTIHGTDDAIWRRVHMIPFTVSIPPESRDGSLGSTLLEELPGILNWALKGCLAWQKCGLMPPDAVLAATDQYRAEQDVLGDFIKEKCERDPTFSEPARTLYSAYHDWCRDSGEKALSKKGFGQQLEERGFLGNRTGRERLRRGIRLRDVMT